MAKLLWTHGAWTVAGSARVDWFQNYDGNQRHVERNRLDSHCHPASAMGADTSSIRASALSRKLGSHWAVSASGFRAFRAPTPSELYRSTQVGNQLTKPNGLLKSERATGWESGRGFAMALGNDPGQLFSHPDQPPDLCRHHQSELVAHPADARESWPD